MMKNFFSSSIVALLGVDVMDRVRVASTVLSFVGFLLILGSVITLPHPQVEQVYFGYLRVWADRAFSLEPHSIKMFTLDTYDVNDTVVSTHVETSGNLTFKIYQGLSMDKPPKFEWAIANSSVAGSSKDLFWTANRERGNMLVFENDNSFFVNAYITIKTYSPWYSEWRGVTRYDSLLNPVLIFPGIAAVSAGLVMGYAYRIRRVKSIDMRRLWTSALIGLIGVSLILGSATTIPYTAKEWVEDTHDRVWADETFSLEPNATKTFTIDHAVANSSIIGVYISETTGTVYFDFLEGRDVFCKVFAAGMTNSSIMDPRPTFWTYPWQSDTWNIVFRNTNPVAINVSLRIVEHFYRMLMLEEVTHHVPVLGSLFAYPGVIMIAVAAIIMPEDTENISTPKIPKYD
jgi:hypothetical protein